MSPVIYLSPDSMTPVMNLVPVFLFFTGLVDETTSTAANSATTLATSGTIIFYFLTEKYSCIAN
jgi:hypothetical protein